MKKWYRSGIEGYCKAASRMMGLPDNNSGWGNFGRDLFADGRFDDPAQASKTWTLSRHRSKGRSNRPNLFEEGWIGKHGSDCELEAVHTCVHSLCGKASDSALYELYRGDPYAFASRFHDMVLPAIEDGLTSERFHPADIAHFSLSIDNLLGKLNPSLPQTFRNFAIPLVAGIIYGPDHALARSGTNTVTLRRSHSISSEPAAYNAIDTHSIVLTQIFSTDAGLIGHSSSFDADSVVLLGRDSDIACYLEKCDEEFRDAIKQGTPILFPIAHNHRSTSKAHGIIARFDDTWYYCDLSSNGSYIHNIEQPSAVHRGTTALAPGDRIYLGLSEAPEEDADAFTLATGVLVSFKVDEVP